MSHPVGGDDAARVKTLTACRGCDVGPTTEAPASHRDEPDVVASVDEGRGGEIAPHPPSSLLDPAAAPSVWGWAGPLLVAALAAWLRLVDLARPRALVFDETFYVKQAYSLLTLGYEGVWGDGADELFVAGDFSALSPSPEYVVHPPVGKWLIAAGMRVLGPENPAGWRLGTAVAGVLTVFLLARLGRRLFASTILGCLAALLLALDGMHVVESRTGILDVFVGLFAVAAFGAVVLDRVRSRARLAERRGPELLGGADVGLGFRWWLVAAGVLSGLAMGVKWSGVYVLAVLGVLTVGWSVAARRAIGGRGWLRANLLRDAAAAFLSLVPVAALTYVATWASWFANPNAYHRDWAANHPEQERTWLPDTLDSWLHFHRLIWDFHHGLSTPHAYEAAPLGWIVQWRPTFFFWEEVSGAGVDCGADRCAQAITSVGNPVLWWLGVPALAIVLLAAVRLRDWRAWTVAAGYVALWVPWFLYPHRTTFTFYAVALAPFVALAVAYALGLLIGLRPGRRPPRLDWSRGGPWAALAVVLLTATAAAFFWPVWTAQVISVDDWRLRMWLPSWV